MGKRVQTPKAGTICQRMGELLQISRYENNAERNGRVATPENPGDLLETVEESQNKVQDDKEVPFA